MVLHWSRRAEGDSEGEREDVEIEDQSSGVSGGDADVHVVGGPGTKLAGGRNSRRPSPLFVERNDR